MADRQEVPASPLVGLQAVRCRREECHRLLARVRLEGASQVEIKCPRCQLVSTFASHSVKVRLKPDGQGGYLQVPVSDG